MARSLWKGPYVETSILRLISQKSEQTTFKTWSRKSMILPIAVGLKLEVHNGKSYNTLTITDDMIGHKLGEFVPTRKFPIHKKK